MGDTLHRAGGQRVQTTTGRTTTGREEGHKNPPPGGQTTRLSNASVEVAAHPCRLSQRVDTGARQGVCVKTDAAGAHSGGEGNAGYGLRPLVRERLGWTDSR